MITSRKQEDYKGGFLTIQGKIFTTFHAIFVVSKQIVILVHLRY